MTRDAYLADSCEKSVMIIPIAPHSCPIRERTADGVSVGRCWHHCPKDVCPRHGDVHSALQRYRETGELTDIRDHKMTVGR
jgi:hypothetical protein